VHNVHPQLEMKGRKKPYKYILSVSNFVLYDLPIYLGAQVIQDSGGCGQCGGCVCVRPVVSNSQYNSLPNLSLVSISHQPCLHLNMHYGAFTLDIKSVLNENLCGILGGTQC
jgi:hypothetical protein